MMPCSSDFVPSMRLRERGREEVPADALVEGAQLEEVENCVVNVERKGERGVDVEERILLAGDYSECECVLELEVLRVDSLEGHDQFANQEGFRDLSF